MKRAKTETIIKAMLILANDIVSEDGVANAAIREAAERLEELHGGDKKPCKWSPPDGYHDDYMAACGYSVEYEEGCGGPRQHGTKYCPRCGGLVKVKRLA